MSSEPNSELNNVTPLSQARLSRKSSDYTVGITEDRLREILSECITAKLTRLENSINRMADQFEDVRNGKAKDAALRVTTDLNATDIALSGINLTKEEYYSYTCSHLAEILCIRKYDVTNMIKKLGLRGDTKYHICITIGKNTKVHKWSEATLQKLKENLNSQ